MENYVSFNAIVNGEISIFNRRTIIIKTILIYNLDDKIKEITLKINDLDFKFSIEPLKTLIIDKVISGDKLSVLGENINFHISGLEVSDG